MSESPSTSPSLDLNEFLCFALHSTAQAIGRANKPMLEKIGLTYPQYLVMIVLWKEDNRTVSAIGEKLFLESSTLTPLLKRLEGLGHVRRTRSGTDERQVVVELTEQGSRLRSDAVHVHDEVVRRLGLSSGELEHLQSVLEQLIEATTRTTGQALTGADSGAP